MSKARNETEGASGRPQKGAFAALWDWLGAIRVAIILFIVWAAFSALGTLIPQGQAEEFYLGKYGQFLGRLFISAGFNHIYASFLYGAILALFLGSVLVCSVRRTKQTWRRTFAAKPDFPPQDISKMRHHRLIAPKRKVTAKEMLGHLRHLGFAARAGVDSRNQELLLGRRGTLAPWGIVAVHFSLLIIFIGAFIGRTPWFGGFDTNLVIREGETAYDAPPPHDVPQHAGAWKKHFDFGVHLVDFWIDRTETGFITKYASRVEVVDGGKVALTKDITVNDPLVYKGVKFYQSSYLTEGAEVEVTTPDGKTHQLLFSNANAGEPEQPYAPDMMSWPTLDLENGEHLQFLAHGYEPGSMGGSLPGAKGQPAPSGAKIWLFVVKEGEDATKWPQIGWVSAEEPVEFQGMKFRLVGLVDATVLSVRRDPGIPIVWFGCALAVLGMVAGLYLRQGTLRVVLSHRENRTEILAGASITGDSHVAESYLARLEKAILAK